MTITRDEWEKRTADLSHPLTWPAFNRERMAKLVPSTDGVLLDKEAMLRAARAKALAALNRDAPKHWAGCDGTAGYDDEGYCLLCGRRR